MKSQKTQKTPAQKQKLPDCQSFRPFRGIEKPKNFRKVWRKATCCVFELFESSYPPNSSNIELCLAKSVESGISGFQVIFYSNFA